MYTNENPTIKESSWHFQLVCAVMERPSETTGICAYCWMVVWSIIVAVGCSIFAVCMAILLLVVAFSGLFSTAITMGTAFVSALVWVMIGTLAIASIRVSQQAELTHFKEYRIFPEHREDKQPNLLILWLKAKKSKFCPTINIVE